MPRLLVPLALAGLGLLLLAGAALAADGSAVTLPWGDWLTDALKAVVAFAIPYLVLLIRQVIATHAPILGLLLTQARIEQMVRACADYALAAQAGAAQGKVLSLDLGIPVAARFVQRALDAAPAALVREVGGVEGLAHLALRAFKFDETVSAESLIGPVLARLAAGKP